MASILQKMKESVNHPSHYNEVPGMECIDVVENFGFNKGNAMKYIWRCTYKGKQIEDLEKASWYIQREIGRLKKVELLKKRRAPKPKTRVKK